jgi:hypothetical protein
MKRFRSASATRIVAPLALLLLATFLLAAAYAQQAISPAFASAERKIAWIQENGRSPNPSARPTVLTATEWNAYLNQGGVKLPDGLSNIRISSQPGLAHGDAEIDFDRLTANRTRANPLLALFTGTHHVTVTARAGAANGIGTVHVESVMFDGVAVPRFALEYFADRYLRPKYGKAVGMDCNFPIHSRVDTAIVGSSQVTITQR